MNRPTKTQHELLSFISGFIKGHGYGPSYREIMRALNYKSVSTVAIHVDELIKKGHLIKHERSARSLEVVSGSTAPQPALKAVPSRVWLLETIEKKFAEAEVDVPKKNVDDLYVLVGALHVLELEEAYETYRDRLLKMRGQQK